MMPHVQNVFPFALCFDLGQAVGHPMHGSDRVRQLLLCFLLECLQKEQQCKMFMVDARLVS